jgi:hypothetical protein
MSLEDEVQDAEQMRTQWQSCLGWDDFARDVVENKSLGAADLISQYRWSFGRHWGRKITLDYAGSGLRQNG